MENHNYFIHKAVMARKAEEHAKRVGQIYREDICNSIVHTDRFGGEDGKDPTCTVWPVKEWPLPKVLLIPETTVEAVFRENDERAPVLLNFASYKSPGGMFKEGSSAQEETLCHASTLYNVLLNHWDFYDWNKKHLNNALYTNRAMYTPNILFENENTGEKKYAGVLTCAAPNRRVYVDLKGGNPEENSVALNSRIRFIFECLLYRTEISYMTQRRLILGAFGCGVFGQSATEVANLFVKYILGGWVEGFSTIEFAIPPGQNFDEFLAVFSQHPELNINP